MSDKSESICACVCFCVFVHACLFVCSSLMPGVCVAVTWWLCQGLWLLCHGICAAFDLSRQKQTGVIWLTLTGPVQILLPSSVLLSHFCLSEGGKERNTVSS